MQEISATEAACVAAVHCGIQIEFFGQNWIFDKQQGIRFAICFACLYLGAAVRDAPEGHFPLRRGDVDKECKKQFYDVVLRVTVLAWPIGLRAGDARGNEEVVYETLVASTCLVQRTPTS